MWLPRLPCLSASILQKRKAHKGLYLWSFSWAGCKGHTFFSLTCYGPEPGPVALPNCKGSWEMYSNWRGRNGSEDSCIFMILWIAENFSISASRNSFLPTLGQWRRNKLQRKNGIRVTCPDPCPTLGWIQADARLGEKAYRWPVRTEGVPQLVISSWAPGLLWSSTLLLNTGHFGLSCEQ